MASGLSIRTETLWLASEDTVESRLLFGTVAWVSIFSDFVGMVQDEVGVDFCAVDRASARSITLPKLE